MCCESDNEDLFRGVFDYVYGCLLYTSKQTKTPAVPAHLQDAHYGAAEKLGHGVGYKYAHDYPNHYGKQQYLPDGLTDREFYLSLIHILKMHWLTQVEQP